jgi:hypothetical protein
VVGTYDGDTLLLYVNGAQVGISTTPSGNISYSFNTSVCIGEEANDGAPDDCDSTATLSGTIDDVRIYNRALTAAEVKQLYKLGTATVRP